MSVCLYVSMLICHLFGTTFKSGNATLIWKLKISKEAFWWVIEFGAKIMWILDFDIFVSIAGGGERIKQYIDGQNVPNIIYCSSIMPKEI